jgi:protein-L-isoaspartate(D-aspartate) O-methyltransferase
MLDEQLARLGITDDDVLAAIRKVPRDEFVPTYLRDAAYENRPLPIGYDQTISQPLVVAEMTQLARPRPDAKALDVGTGSGYQAAILAELVDHVYSIEIIRPLAEQACARLARLGYHNVTVRHGNGRLGWPEEAPFDLIIVAAAPLEVPPALVEQLAPGGRLVMPVGAANEQHLVVVAKSPDGAVRQTTATPVAFVPLTDGSDENIDA